MRGYSDLADLSEAHLRVFFGKLGLMLTLIVELAAVLLCISMFTTESEVTFTGETKKANFLFALPA